VVRKVEKVVEVRRGEMNLGQNRSRRPETECDMQGGLGGTSRNRKVLLREERTSGLGTEKNRGKTQKDVEKPGCNEKKRMMASQPDRLPV